MKYIILLTFLACLYAVGCNSKKSEREALKEKIANRYSAIYQDDSLGGYVYELQQRIIDGKRFLCFSGKIKELVKIDSNFLLHIKLSKSSDKKYYIAELRANNDIANKLTSEIKEAHSHSGIFVFSVYKISFFDGSKEDEDEDGNTYKYDISTILLNGDLVYYSIF